MILVDTTIWSLALRRRKHDLSSAEQALVDEWRRLVEEGLACLCGPIRQEILSGIRSSTVFRELRDHLDAFPHVPVQPDDYDRAAEFYNTLREHGVAGSAIDLLLCAIAAAQEVPIFTTDRDFTRYARHLPIALHV